MMIGDCIPVFRVSDCMLYFYTSRDMRWLHTSLTTRLIVTLKFFILITWEATKNSNGSYQYVRSVVKIKAK